MKSVIERELVEMERSILHGTQICACNLGLYPAPQVSTRDLYTKETDLEKKTSVVFAIGV